MARFKPLSRWPYRSYLRSVENPLGRIVGNPLIGIPITPRRPALWKITASLSHHLKTILQFGRESFKPAPESHH